MSKSESSWWFQTVWNIFVKIDNFPKWGWKRQRTHLTLSTCSFQENIPKIHCGISGIAVPQRKNCFTTVCSIRPTACRKKNINSKLANDLTTSYYLEDHPMTCKWLILMVSKSRLWDPFQMAFFSMAALNGGWSELLDVGWSSKVFHSEFPTFFG